MTALLLPPGAESLCLISFQRLSLRAKPSLFLGSGLLLISPAETGVAIGDRFQIGVGGAWDPFPLCLSSKQLGENKGGGSDSNRPHWRRRRFSAEKEEEMAVVGTDCRSVRGVCCQFSLLLFSLWPNRFSLSTCRYL